MSQAPLPHAAADFTPVRLVLPKDKFLNPISGRQLQLAASAGGTSGLGADGHLLLSTGHSPPTLGPAAAPHSIVSPPMAALPAVGGASPIPQHQSALDDSHSGGGATRHHHPHNLNIANPHALFSDNSSILGGGGGIFMTVGRHADADDGGRRSTSRGVSPSGSVMSPSSSVRGVGGGVSAGSRRYGDHTANDASTRGISPTGVSVTVPTAFRLPPVPRGKAVWGQTTVPAYYVSDQLYVTPPPVNLIEKRLWEIARAPTSADDGGVAFLTYLDSLTPNTNGPNPETSLRRQSLLACSLSASLGTHPGNGSSASAAAPYHERSLPEGHIPSSISQPAIAGAYGPPLPYIGGGVKAGGPSAGIRDHHQVTAHGRSITTAASHQPAINPLMCSPFPFVVHAGVIDYIIAEHVSVGRWSLDAFKALLQWPYWSFNYCGPMLAAVRARSSGSVRILLDESHRIDPNTGCPLRHAVMQGDVDIVDALLRCDRINPNRGSPLFYAIARNNPAMVRMLLDHPRTMLNKITAGHSMTPLIASIRYNSLECFQLLVTHHRVDVNRGFCWTPLQVAVMCGRPEFVRLLLNRPLIEPNATIHRAHTKLPVVLACENNDGNVLRVLLEDSRVSVPPSYIDQLEEENNLHILQILSSYGPQEMNRMGYLWSVRYVLDCLIVMMLLVRGGIDAVRITMGYRGLEGGGGSGSSSSSSSSSHQYVSATSPMALGILIFFHILAAFAVAAVMYVNRCAAGGAALVATSNPFDNSTSYEVGTHDRMIAGGGGGDTSDGKRATDVICSRSQAASGFGGSDGIVGVGSSSSIGGGLVVHPHSAALRTSSGGLQQRLGGGGSGSNHGTPLRKTIGVLGSETVLEVDRGDIDAASLLNEGVVVTEDHATTEMVRLVGDDGPAVVVVGDGDITTGSPTTIVGRGGATGSNSNLIVLGSSLPAAAGSALPNVLLGTPRSTQTAGAASGLGQVRAAAHGIGELPPMVPYTRKQGGGGGAAGGAGGLSNPSASPNVMSSSIQLGSGGSIASLTTVPHHTHLTSNSSTSIIVSRERFAPTNAISGSISAAAAATSGQVISPGPPSTVTPEAHTLLPAPTFNLHLGSGSGSTLHKRHGPSAPLVNTASCLQTATATASTSHGLSGRNSYAVHSSSQGLSTATSVLSGRAGTSGGAYATLGGVGGSAGVGGGASSGAFKAFSYWPKVAVDIGGRRVGGLMSAASVLKVAAAIVPLCLPAAEVWALAILIAVAAHNTPDIFSREVHHRMLSKMIIARLVLCYTPMAVVEGIAMMQLSSQSIVIGGSRAGADTQQHFRVGDINVAAFIVTVLLSIVVWSTHRFRTSNNSGGRGGENDDGARRVSNVGHHHQHHRAAGGYGW